MKQKILNFIYEIFAIFARIYLKRISPKIIWITWSVWKTSCRMVVSDTLKHFLKDKKIYTSPKNYNSEIWIIASIFQIEDYTPSPIFLFCMFFKIFFISIFWSKKYDILILEYWVDKPEDMDFLIWVARPDIAIFTKLDFIHVANFPSQEELWLEKSKLIFSAKNSVYLNKDDFFQMSIFPEVDTKKYFYNESFIKFDYSFENWEIFTNFDFFNSSFKTNLLWEENIVYLELALIILINEFFVKFDEKNEISYKIQPWRFSIFEWIFDSILIDSSYNSWPESMKAMINNAVSLRKKLFPEYENIFVLWDMREIWESSSQKHKELFDFASKFWEIFSVWKETSVNFWKHLWNFKYSSQAWKILKNYLEENSDKKFLILFKWSQNTIFLEEAVKEVLKNKEDEKFLVRQEKYWKKTDF